MTLPLSGRLPALTEVAKARALTQDELVELLLIQDSSEEARLDLDRKSRELKKIEDAAESLLLDQIRKNKVLNVQAGTLTACITGPKYKPHVQKWDDFYAFILETQDFSLLERRPSAKAVTERWDDNQVVPGVEKFPIWSLSKTRS